MLSMMPSGSSADPAALRIVGLIFLVISVVILGIGVGATLLTYFTGRGLAQHRRRTLCLVVGGLCCLSAPWGTAIGVCTIIVLSRPDVKALFETGPPPL
jgi:hypothetical protein